MADNKKILIYTNYCVHKKKKKNSKLIHFIRLFGCLVVVVQNIS